MDWVEQLANDGITSGCNGGADFCPNNLATRAQAAVLITETFNLTIP